MKKYFLILLIVSAFFLSCSKKEEPLVIKKQDEQQEQSFPKNITLDSIKSAPRDSAIVSDSTTDNQLQGQNSAGRKEVFRINSSKISGYIGKTCVVKGLVVDVVEREKVAYLNFDKKYPKNSMSGTIFQSSFDKFGDLSKYKNKTVEITGKVTEFNGKPQIIMNSPNQIKIKE